MSALRASRRRRAAGVAALAALLAAPEPAAAHGLYLTPALPIPVWLFAVAAALVVVLSFAAIGRLWAAPLLADRAWRPVLPAAGRMLTAPATQAACATAGVAALALVIVAGLRGEATDNFASVFVFIVLWVGVAIVSALLGDVYSAFDPYRALGRVGAALAVRCARPADGDRPQPLVAYPASLGRAPAAAGLLAFAFLELASARSPRDVAVFAIAYSLAMLAGMAVYGPAAWCRNADAFGVYFGLLARISPLEVRGRRLGLRRPLSALRDVERVPGTGLLVAVMIGSVSFDGASSSSLWQHHVLDPVVGALNGAGVALSEARQITTTLGILACVALVHGFYRLGVAGMATARPRPDRRGLAGVFVPSLVPIALAYLVAHNFTLLVIGGQSIVPALTDPLGHGNGVATASNAAILSANAYWYVEVGALVAGHVAGVALAHDLALTTYARARDALRSQYWMLAVMVGFTVLALWLLAASKEI